MATSHLPLTADGSVKGHLNMSGKGTAPPADLLAFGTNIRLVHKLYEKFWKTWIYLPSFSLQENEALVDSMQLNLDPFVIFDKNDVRKKTGPIYKYHVGEYSVRYHKLAGYFSAGNALSIPFEAEIQAQSWDLEMFRYTEGAIKKGHVPEFGIRLRGIASSQAASGKKGFRFPSSS